MSVRTVSVRAVGAGLIASLALLLVGLAFVAQAQAAFPGTNGKIAYDGYDLVGGTTSLYAITADRRTEGALAPAGSVQIDPAWSPDGSKLAFSQGTQDIVVVDADGSNPVFLAKPAPSGFGVRDPAWSPDGTTVAYTCGVSICAANADGSGTFRTLVTRAANPSWSPDGSKVAFLYFGAVGGPIPTRALVGYANASGGAITLLTAPFEAHGSVLTGGPDWSPDGSKLVYQRRLDESLSDGQYRRSLDLYTVNTTGTAVETRLTHSSTDEEQASWSPDGTRIVFVRHRAGESQGSGRSSQWNLYTVKNTGAGTKRLTKLRVNESSPSWGSQP